MLSRPIVYLPILYYDFLTIWCDFDIMAIVFHEYFIVSDQTLEQLRPSHKERNIYIYTRAVPDSSFSVFADADANNKIQYSRMRVFVRHI